MPSLAPAGIGMLRRIRQGQDFSPGHCNSCTLQKVRRADSVAGGSTHTKGQRAVETRTQLLLRGLQTSGCSLASALFYLSLQWVLRELVVLFCLFFFVLNKEQPGGCIRDRGTCSLQLTRLQIKATAAHGWISVSLSPPTCTRKHTSTHVQALKQSISQCIYMYTYIYIHIYLLLFLLQVFLLQVY